MGGRSSKATEPSSHTETPKKLKPVQKVEGVKDEKKPELFDAPWRDVKWDKSTKTKLMQSLKDYKPSNNSVPEARILLIGEVSAGKSSFFNSINNVFRGNITGQAKAGYKDTSLTLKYRTYKVKADRGGQPMAFLLCDTMGLQKTPNAGVNPEDIVGILKGYIPDGYQFNPSQPKTTDDCQQCSRLTLADKIHCVVFVMNSSSPGLLDTGTKKKFDQIREKSDFHDVPLVVLLTKVDRACPHVAEDLKNVYRSSYLRDQIKKASEYLGIAELNVIPVKNYSSETELNDTCDILLLSAMKQMLNFADNYLDNFD